MNLGDQDEEVEEEEEFHEVDEEKHKTSQESVSGTSAPVVNSNSSLTEPLDSTTMVSGGDTNVASTTTETNLCTNEDQEKLSQICKEDPGEPSAPNSVEVTDDIVDTSVNPSENDDKRSSSENSDASKTVSSDSTSTTTTANFSTAKDSNVEVSDIVDNGESQSENNSKNVDWANMMLSSTRSDKSATDEDSPVSEEPSLNQDYSNSSNKAVADQTIDDIITATEQKLNICDDSTSSEKQTDHQTSSELALDSSNIIVVQPSTNQDQTVTENSATLSCEKDVSETIPHTNDQPTLENINVETAEEAKEPEAEEPEKKELDMDEDVKNPQYIPKKGVFYEHDDRSHDAVDKQASSSLSMDKEEELSKSKELVSSKKVATQEKPADNRRNNNRRQRTEGDRWNHDLFRDDKQKPKSKTELINVYGYDIRQERTSRNQSDNRPQRGNVNNSSLPQGGHEDRRSRQGKEVRSMRNNRPGNSHERKPRRQNATRNTNRNNDGAQVGPKRDNLNAKPIKSEPRDVKDSSEEKQNSAFSTNRRDREPVRENKNTRNDSRGRRKNSRDRPLNLGDDKLPKTNTVMSPITVWTNEDTAIAETFKETPLLDRSSAVNVNQQQQPSQVIPQQQQQQQQLQQQPQFHQQQPRVRPTDNWEQNQPNKGFYQEKIAKNPEENRHYGSRNRSYQDRGELHRPAQSMARNQWNDRSNQHYTEWHRANNSTSYGKSSDYIVKTQTFENSRLSQANMNRSNERDLRELINARRMHGQQNFQPKVQLGSDQHMQHRGHSQNQLMHNQFPHQHLIQHHHQQQQGTQHLLQHQQQLHQHQHQQATPQHQQPHQSQQQSQTPGPAQQPAQNSAHQSQSSPQVTQQQQQTQNQRPKQVSQGQSHQNHSRQQNILMGASASSNHDVNRLGSDNASSSNDLMNSRPIIKTDAYTGAAVAAHQQTGQQMPQHSQAHRVMSGPVVQQAPANSHMVPTHMGAGGAPAQYYSTPNNSRDPAGAASALAAAYHGYMPSGHSMMDTTRYHMTSQQLSEHGYMAPGGQTNVASASVMHQQGMYADASAAGGTVASSAYLAQAGSGLPSASNIPVTGAGPPPPLPPVSYLQQYPPPPYSNPYTQPQHNQAPAQSGHAYPPYWNYI